MKIIIVEDDYLQSNLLKSVLSKNFGEYLHELIIVDTEFKFRSRIKEFEQILPNLFIIDVMLRWTDPSFELNEQVPEKVLVDGFYTAGIRCQKLISDNIKLKHIPIILYTVLDKEDLTDSEIRNSKLVHYLSKDREFDSLISLVREITTIKR